MRNGTKKEKAARGRPRTFQEDEVLDRVRGVFMAKGFSGASVDDLAKAARLNRPSLYAAFGDKEQLYLRTLERYGEVSAGVMEDILARKAPIAQRLGQLYKAAIALYTQPPQGCLIVNTAAVEAPTHPKIGAAAAKLLVKFESIFERAFARAVAEKELSAQPSPATRARLAGGVFDTLAVRARLGASAGELRAVSQSLVPGICAGPNESKA